RSYNEGCNVLKLLHIVGRVSAAPPGKKGDATVNKKPAGWQVFFITALLANDHQLLVHKLFDPQVRQLASVTRTFYAAERQLCRSVGEPVDVYHPGLNARRHFLRALDVLAEHRAAQTVVGIVSQCDRFVVAFHHVNLRYRTEELLEVRRVITRDMRQDGRLKEASVTLNRLAAMVQLRAIFHRLVNLFS